FPFAVARVLKTHDAEPRRPVPRPATLDEPAFAEHAILLTRIAEPLAVTLTLVVTADPAFGLAGEILTAVAETDAPPERGGGAVTWKLNVAELFEGFGSVSDEETDALME